MPVLRVQMSYDCRYASSLTKPMLAGIKGGFFNGLLIGFSFFAFLCAFALALWYGGIRVRDGTYTGEMLLLSTVRQPHCIDLATV